MGKLPKGTKRARNGNENASDSPECFPNDDGDQPVSRTPTKFREALKRIRDEDQENQLLQYYCPAYLEELH